MTAGTPNGRKKTLMPMKTKPLAIDQLEMSRLAWGAREMARIIADNGTKVGCVVRGENGESSFIARGCNLEHPFRCHDIHAEVNAISGLMMMGHDIKLTHVLIAAERESFTPCGGCMDWIMRFGDENTVVMFQKHPDMGTAMTHIFRAKELPR